jgi:hypothetical protein
VLSVVTSHYDGINLPAIGQGFDALEEEATPAAMSLARLVSREAVLQARGGEKVASFFICIVCLFFSM